MYNVHYVMYMHYVEVKRSCFAQHTSLIVVAVYFQVWLGWPIIYCLCSVFLVVVPLYASPKETGTAAALTSLSSMVFLCNACKDMTDMCAYEDG